MDNRNTTSVAGFVIYALAFAVSSAASNVPDEDTGDFASLLQQDLVLAG